MGTKTLKREDVMGYKCPKCGYERRPGDLSPEYECPKCGIIYSKAKSGYQKAKIDFGQIIVEEKPFNFKKFKQGSVNFSKRFFGGAKSYNRKTLGIALVITSFLVGMIAYVTGEKSWKDIIEDSKPAVVVVETEEGHGSGFLISDDGYIFTNAHVIGENKEAIVKLSNGKKKIGTLVKKGAGPLDIAVLSIDGDDYDYLQLSGKTCSEGDEVIVMGSPLGFQETTTKGIVSNANRPVKDVKYIQTDTAINSGNSGGPLINKKGRVVGITTMKLNDYNDNNVEGMGFAIDINFAKDFQDGKLDDLVASFKGEDDKESYIKKLYITKHFLTIMAIPMEIELCRLYSEAWRKSIDNRYDNDFNDDIDRVYSIAKNEGILEELENYKMNVKSTLRELSEFDYYPKAHKKISELYGAYSMLHAFAQYPSGNYHSYNSKVNELKSETIRIANELDLLMPEEPEW